MIHLYVGGCQKTLYIIPTCWSSANLQFVHLPSKWSLEEDDHLYGGKAMQLQAVAQPRK